MVPNVSVRTYRPRQMSLVRENRPARPRVTLGLSVDQSKILAIVVAVLLVVGLTGTSFFHSQMEDMRAGAAQLRTRNTLVNNENVRLLAVRAQLASKAHVVVLAGTKLQLFEPDKGQVRRM